MGPDSTGKFEPVQVKSIHRKRLPVNEVMAGQAAAFALKKVKKKEVRKGSVLLGTAGDPPKAVWEFKGEVVILHHPTTIMTNYQVTSSPHVTHKYKYPSGNGSHWSSTPDSTNYVDVNRGVAHRR